MEWIFNGIPICWDVMDERRAHDILHTATRLGIQFIDTADSYGQGPSELLIDQAIQG